MTYFLGLIYLLLALIFRKNKKVTVILAIILILLFGWAGENADSSIYLWRYEGYDSDSLESITEPLFTFIMKAFNACECSFEAFKIILAIFVITSFAIIIAKFTDNINFALLLYFIYPFCMDVVQLRTTLALVFVYFGFLNYFSQKTKVKKIILYCIFVFIAGMIHYSMLVYFILIIPMLIKNNKIKEGALWTILLVEIIFVIVVGNSGQLNGNSTLTNKINFVLNSAQKYNTKAVYKTTFEMIISFVLFYVIADYEYKKTKKDSENRIIIKSTIDFNKYIMLVVPLLTYTVDLYRLQTGLLLLDYITFSYYFDIKNKAQKDEAIFVILSMMLPALILYLLVLNNNNMYTVFLPLFENNTLLQ